LVLLPDPIGVGIIPGVGIIRNLKIPFVVSSGIKIFSINVGISSKF
jgi:hypothetical protein